MKWKRIDDFIAEKLKSIFNCWTAKSSMLSYLKRARVIAISKEDTCFPKTGVRTVCVQNNILKIFERCIHNRITPNIKFHTHQRGFIKGKQTMHNIVDLIEHMKKSVSNQEEERNQGVQTHLRQRDHYLFCDLKAAFDGCVRPLLLERMRDLKVPNDCLNAIAITLEDTSMHINGSTI